MFTQIPARFLLLSLLFAAGCKNELIIDLKPLEVFDETSNISTPARLKVKVLNCSSDMTKKLERELPKLFNEFSRPSKPRCEKVRKNGAIFLDFQAEIATKNSSADVIIGRSSGEIYKDGDTYYEPKHLFLVFSADFRERFENLLEEVEYKFDEDHFFISFVLEDDGPARIKAWNVFGNGDPLTTLDEWMLPNRFMTVQPSNVATMQALEGRDNPILISIERQVDR